MEPDKETDRMASEVIGSAIEVHRNLGAGYLERLYEDALAVELMERGIPFHQQAEFAVVYKGSRLGTQRVDLLVADRLIVELKAVDRLVPLHKAQVISYLKASGKQLGLLINFNVPVLRQGIQRIVLT